MEAPAFLEELLVLVGAAALIAYDIVIQLDVHAVAGLADIVDQLVSCDSGDPRQEGGRGIVGVALFVQTQQGHLYKVFTVRALQAAAEIGARLRPRSAFRRPQ